jgi:beta-glucosidase
MGTAAEEAIAAADTVVIVTGVSSGEFADRENLSLPEMEDALVSRVAGLRGGSGSNVVVVVHCPGAILLPWAEEVDSILLAFLPGQEDG